MIDSLLEMPPKKGKGVDTVKAYAEFPANWNENERLITAIHLHSGHFEEQLNKFLDDLEQLRNQ